MIKKALLLLLLTAVWAFGSWWYYTCMIKGFCYTNGAFTSPSNQIEAAPSSTMNTELATRLTMTEDTAKAEFIDQDNDAISDADERSLGTNANSDDSDADGMKDKLEIGTDLQNPTDSDNDGIINALDNDTLLSLDEKTKGTNPLLKDSDGDGLNDALEANHPDALGTDPTNSDTDGDGIFDIIDTEDNNKSERKNQPTLVTSNNGDTVTIDTDPVTDISTGDIPIQKSRLYFPSRSANPSLSDTAEHYFKEVSEWLSKNPNNSITLTGHTDSIGQAKNNLNLGLSRAVKIKELMVKLGANATQVNVDSMGETQPIASNDTKTGRYKNRRVELIPTIKNK